VFLNEFSEFFLFILSVSMFLSSVFVDLKRKRREWKKEWEIKNSTEKDYNPQIKDREKANWHNGFQVASGIIAIYLLGMLAVDQGWI